MALEVLLVEDSKTQAQQIKETLESVGLRVPAGKPGGGLACQDQT